MDLKELITKTEGQRNTVLEVIQKAETTEEVFREIVVERFLKGFLFDLKALAKKSGASENTLPIDGVVGQSEQLKAFREWYDNLSIEEIAWYDGKYEETFLRL